MHPEMTEHVIRFTAREKTLMSMLLVTFIFLGYYDRLLSVRFCGIVIVVRCDLLAQQEALSPPCSHITRVTQQVKYKALSGCDGVRLPCGGTHMGFSLVMRTLTLLRAFLAPVGCVAAGLL